MFTLVPSATGLLSLNTTGHGYNGRFELWSLIVIGQFEEAHLEMKECLGEPNIDGSVHAGHHLILNVFGLLDDGWCSCGKTRYLLLLCL